MQRLDFFAALIDASSLSKYIFSRLYSGYCKYESDTGHIWFFGKSRKYGKLSVNSEYVSFLDQTR